jgi:hypothetical protein
VATEGQRRNPLEITVGKYLEELSLEKKRGLEDNIKIYLRKINGEFEK